MPEVAEVMESREQMLEFQMHKGTGKGGSLRDDPQPVQPQRGYFNGPPRWEVGPTEFGAEDRANSVSRAGKHRESPPFSLHRIRGLAFGKIGVEMGKIRRNNENVFCVMHRAFALQ